MGTFEQRALLQQREHLSQLLRQAKAADPAKARELLASAQQAREQAESEVAKIDESIRRSEVHRHG